MLSIELIKRRYLFVFVSVYQLLKYIQWIGWPYTSIETMNIPYSFERYTVESRLPAIEHNAMLWSIVCFPYQFFDVEIHFTSESYKSNKSLISILSTAPES